MDNLFQNYYRDHPTLLLSLCYFLVTLIGVIYSYYFYAEFGIAILKFADLSDYLLASILEPMSVVFFVVVVVFYFFTYKVELWSRRRFKGYGRLVEKSLKPKYSDPLLFSFFIIALTVMYVKGFAEDNAQEIKDGNMDEYNVLVPAYQGGTRETSVALLGSTSRFTYFYNVTTKESLVVPIENISFMKKVLSNDSKEN